MTTLLFGWNEKLGHRESMSIHTMCGHVFALLGGEFTHLISVFKFHNLPKEAVEFFFIGS